MSSRSRLLAPLVAAAAVAALAGCGDEIEVAEPYYDGALLFNERCSGCHTLDAAASNGSRPEGEVEATERTDGPNFNVRAVSREDALFAIRNGGFSGAIMPANIVVGEDAEAVATFLEQYSGKSGKDPKEATGGGANTGKPKRSGE